MSEFDKSKSMYEAIMKLHYEPKVNSDELKPIIVADAYDYYCYSLNEIDKAWKI